MKGKFPGKGANQKKAPVEDDDESEDGSPTASDSAENKKARRKIFMDKIMRGKKC